MPIAEQYAIALPLRLSRRSRFALVFYPPDATRLHLDVYGVPEDQAVVRVHSGVVPRALAASAVLLRFPLPLLRTLFGSPLGVVRRLRSQLALLSLQQPKRLSYELWIEIFDRWTESDRTRLLASSRRAAWPTIDVAVFHADDEAAAGAATQESLRQQWYSPAGYLPLGRQQSLVELLRNSRADYVAILQGGEVLPPHALAMLADQAVLMDLPDALTADEDGIDLRSVRSAPHFKPEIGRALLLSGSLSRGIWLFRRQSLDQVIEPASPYGHADAARLGIALDLLEAKARFRRVPFVLTHLRCDIAATPPASLGDLVRQHLLRAGLPAIVDAATVPIQVRRLGRHPKVSIIIPSAARSRHVTRCLMEVLAKTDYPDFELIIVVSQGALEESQRRILAPVLDSGRARLCLCDTKRFNYSRANNAGVAASDGDLVLLLNDDVAPVDRNWLSSMVGHMQETDVGAVGAKLLYPNGRVQHGGVIIGLAGLAEHVNRFLPADRPGYAHRAVLDQDVSCVTAACLLTRRSAFDAVGGMDESFEIAFNDVDFCLRLRAAGWRIIFAAQARLLHYESATLGHHFSGDRADMEQLEVGRMRARWQSACMADPFHNPNLSLQRGHEWGLAFPPRVSKPFASAAALSGERKTVQRLDLGDAGRDAGQHREGVGRAMTAGRVDVEGGA